MPEQPTDDNIWPDLDELQQRDDVGPTAVAVRLNETVRTHEQPARAGSMRSITLTTAPEMIAGRDLTRKRFYLHCYGPAAGMFIGTDPQQVAAGQAFYIGQYGNVNITHCEQLWARSADTSGTVSIMTEHYAD